MKRKLSPPSPTLSSASTEREDESDAETETVLSLAPPARQTSPDRDPSPPLLRFTLAYPPAVAPNVDVPYDTLGVATPETFLELSAPSAPSAPSAAFQEIDDDAGGQDWTLSWEVPEEQTMPFNDVAMVTTVALGKQRVLSNINPDAANVSWNDGSKSWHDADGSYTPRLRDAPNFIAASGAQLWLRGDGTFENKGPGVRNFINSAGFAIVLAQNGNLLETTVTDINGVRLPVTPDGVLDVPYEPRPLFPPLYEDDFDLQYEFLSPHLRILTAIVGPLRAPTFLSNDDYANLLTITAAGVQYHHVTGFPYHRVNEWTYEDREEGGSRISHQKQEYAVHGKIVGKKPRAAKWTESCSRYAIMQVGGTCASTACLNLLLCNTALRAYCVKVLNGYLHENSLLHAKWRAPGILKSESLTEMLLNVVFKRMCGATISTPDTLFLEGTCLRAQTFQSKLYCNPAGGIVERILLIDIMRALGLSAGLMHAPLGKSASKQYDFALRVTNDSTETLPLVLENFVLSGAYIEGFAVNREGHAVAGIICPEGGRILYDSNYGEVDIDWGTEPARLQAYFETHYYGSVVYVRQMGLYLSLDFIRRHNQDAVVCFSTAPADQIAIKPFARSSDFFCELALRLATPAEPYDIEAAAVVSE